MKVLLLHYTQDKILSVFRGSPLLRGLVISFIHQPTATSSVRISGEKNPAPRRRRLKNKMMERVPLEIALDILCRLPAETIVECKSVCKYWRSIIIIHNEPAGTLNFIALLEFRGDWGMTGVAEFHITEYDDQLNSKRLKIINFPVSYKYCMGWKCDRRVVGSCNGLLCLPRTFGITFLKDAIGICNPLLKQYVTLPLSDNHLKSSFMVRRDIRLRHKQLADPYVVAVGFGYLPCTDEYKVVRVDYHHPNPNIGEIEVYTFGVGGGISISINGGVWRSRGTIDYRLLSSSPLLMNGSLHWLALDGMLSVGGDQKHKQIASFNLKTEAFRMIPIPRLTSLNSFHKPRTQLKNLGRGCLCFIRQLGPYKMDIWVLKDYMNNESWVKEFSINWEGIGKPWCYSPCAFKKKKNGIDDDDHEILLWCDGKSGLVSYDPKTRNFEDVGGGGVQVYVAGVRHRHTSSNVSLKALGEDHPENTRKRKRVVESSWTKRKIIRSIIAKAKAYVYQKGMRGIYPNLKLRISKKTGEGIHPNLKLRISKKTGEVSWTRRRTIRSMILRTKAYLLRRLKKERKERKERRERGEMFLPFYLM